MNTVERNFTARGLVLTRYDAPLLRAFADAIRPPLDMPPSRWVRENLRLGAEQTERPGAFDPEVMPWGPEVLDYEREHPGKVGCIVIKPAQVGFTTLMVAGMVEKIRRLKTNILSVISTREKTIKIATKYFDPMVRGSAEVAVKLAQARDAKRRATLISRPYAGGSVDFVGSGSASELSSESFRDIYLDELEQVQDNFPDKFGDAFMFAQARQNFILNRKFIWAYSHPRFKDAGIHLRFTSLTDQCRWTWDCPHCGAAVYNRWSHVRYTRTDRDGRPDPSSAELRCPTCDGTITDAQRARAIRSRARHADRGGTARFESELPPEQAARCVWGGLSIHGLDNPYRTVAELARKLHGCTSVADRMTVYNLDFGEEFEEVLGTITVENLGEILDTREHIVLPGGPKGCRLLAVGVDVQWPPEKPTLYAGAVAFSVVDVAYIVAMERLQGFPALFEWLKSLTVPLDDATPEGLGVLGPSICTVDAQWEVGLVLDNLRGQSLYSPATNGRVELLPVHYVPELTRLTPAVEVPAKEQINPLRPHLPPLPRFKLCRHPWVDRAMRRLQEKRVRMLCRAPDGFESHVRANVLVPKATRHNYETQELVWEKANPKQPDDWFQALVYAEVGAALRGGIDFWHMEGFGEPTADQTHSAPQRSFFGEMRMTEGGFFKRSW